MYLKSCINLHFSCLLKAFLILLSINFISTAPVKPELSLYSKFIREMRTNKCVIPQQIIFPFNLASKKETDTSPLRICQNTQTSKPSREAVVFCEEIFGNLKSISCRNSSKLASLPEINITLSNDVCNDLNLMKNAIPEEEVLLKKMTDALICEIMCEADFEKACQILFWSYKVQKEIDDFQKVQTGVNISTNEKGKDTVSEIPSESEHISESTLFKPKTLESESSSANSDKAPSNSINPDKQDFDGNKVAEKVVDESSKTQGSASIQSSANSFKYTEENTLIFSSKGTSNAVSDGSPRSDQTSKDQSETKVEVVPKTEVQTVIPISEFPEILEEPETKLTESSMSPDESILQKASINKDNISSSSSEKGSNKFPDKITAEMNNTSTKKSSVQDNTNTPKEDATEISIDASPRGKDTVEEDKSSFLSSYPSSDVPPEVSSLVSISDLETVTLEKMEGDIDVPQTPIKDTDQYTDVDNAEGDADDSEEYPKPNYDGSIDESPQKPELMPITSDSSSNVFVSNPYQNEKPFGELKSIEKFGHGSEDIQVIAAFNDQEDSHFFFYFLSMVLVLMGGYLLFHNKQKIIALIVEGRHERRRRSNGAGYKKLDTK